jgi:hypothetical protein
VTVHSPAGRGVSTIQNNGETGRPDTAIDGEWPANTVPETAPATATIAADRG